MTVYEMIQELAQYDADREVEINVKTSDNYKTYVEVKEYVQEGEETEVKVDIEEDVDDFDISERREYAGRTIVRIDVELR